MRSMNKPNVILPVFVLLFMIGCSKKTVPVQPTTVSKPVAKPAVVKSTPTDSVAAIKTDTSSVVSTPVKPVVKKPVESTPKVISVNDKAAKKTIDGRYYYDLLGHRYWRNNKDGKYYLYNKSMHTDPAFKKP